MSKELKTFTREEVALVCYLPASCAYPFPHTHPNSISTTRRMISYVLPLRPPRLRACPDPLPAQWIIVDAKVYDVTKFKGMHPGGTSVFYEDDIGARGSSPSP